MSLKRRPRHRTRLRIWSVALQRGPEMDNPKVRKLDSKYISKDRWDIQG
jgi:hypothetical protein